MSALGTDMADLARGGRINFLGFVLRLIARLPFLFIAGRMYGAEALGRFAYAVLVVEFAAQLATLGLKRGLAEQLAHSDKPHVCVVWDALLVGALGSLLAMALLFAFPQAMFPNSEIHGLEWLLPISVLALAWSDVMLSALAYRNDVGATVRARAIIEPWTISIAALALAFVSKRDGLIFAYAASMLAAVIASAIPFLKSYGIPHGWNPDPGGLWRMVRRNIPLAAADAVEWGSRRVDIAVLGLFFSPAAVGIYYVAQNVASLPAKLKTSFDPILGPVIARNLAAGDKKAVARQVRQVGFWVIGAQMAVALALGIPGEGVMGLVGPAFVAGTAALGLPPRRRGRRVDGRGQRGGAHLHRAPPQHVHQLHHDHPPGFVVGRPDRPDAPAGLSHHVAGDRAGDCAAPGAGVRGGDQVAAAPPHPRSAGVGLALAA